MALITKAIPDDAAGAVPLNARWSLTGANEGEGLSYRRRFTLALPTGGMAEELVIQPASGLRLKPHDLVFDALDDEAPEQAMVATAENHGLLVSLPRPRLIHSIRFASVHAPVGKWTELFRTDGEVISDEPVISYLNPLSWKGKESQGPARVPRITESSPGGRPHEAPTGKQTAKASPSQEQASELGVTDGRIVVRLRSSSGNVDLDADSLTRFNLATGPENLRLGLRLPDLDSTVYYLQQQFETEQSADLGQAMTEQLNALLKRLRDQLSGGAPADAPPPPLPDPLQIELLVESDAPCEFTLSQFVLHYRLVRQSFPDGAPKQVLHFAGDHPSRQAILIEVPAVATLHAACLKIAGSAGGSTATQTEKLSGLLDAPSTEGLRLDGHYRWSSPLALSSPMQIDGIDLLLAGISPQTQLHLQLLAAGDSGQCGDLIASSEATLSSPRRAQLLRFTWEDTLTLQPATYWLVLESRDGTAIWPLHDQDNAAAMQIGEGRDQTQLAGKSGIAVWVPAARLSAGSTTGAEITLDGTPLTAEADGDDWVYDLTPVLGNSPPASQRQLQILVAGPKPLTVYPPLLEFDPVI